ncbi:MAG: DUF3108 domain-containing protein [Flavobacteriaceae bacterium]|nr:DUF3108 domain-containing protein [Flavobacteriaceae bacterium]
MFDLHNKFNTLHPVFPIYNELFGLNGKVEKREEITIPAGTFDCYVISFETEFKMGIKRKGKTRQWLAKGVGIVKTEDYNKKGKVISKSVLTKFSN